MNLNIENKTFIVCGATSGFGRSVAWRLAEEGAKVIAVARREDKLEELKDIYPEQIETMQGDITQSSTITQLLKQVENIELHGILVNAGGPPAMTFVESTLNDWDEAYRNVFRWKVEITQALLPKMLQQNFGRFVYIESSSVKQPIENLVLSTSMRLSVVGMVKTLSQEIPDKGITFNVLAPGFHDTPAVDRIVKKKSEDLGISKEEARQILEGNIPMKKSGNPDYFATLATWLLSPLSEFVSGQVYALDGAVLKGTL